MIDYYSKSLSAENLKRCYELASLRVKKYFNAEINFVRNRINQGDKVLELGCGYGRIFPYLITKVEFIYGIDNSIENIKFGKKLFQNITNIFFLKMNAVELEFENNTFDKVLCIQNGISAFHVDKIKLIKESLRVVKPDGKVFFSSYSYKFWNHRMKWFEKQSEAGLIGKINYNKSKNGKIVCEDGFSADTVGKRDFNKLLSEFESITYKLTEVDNSCIFCEIIPHKDYFAKK